MAKEIYNTSWWGNAMDTAMTTGTEPNLYGSQHMLYSSNQPDLVTNGGFDTDSNWTKQEGWDISGGTANFTGSAAGNRNLYQDCLEIGEEYELTFQIVRWVSGGIANVSQASPYKYYVGLGTYTERFTATYTNLFLKTSDNTDDFSIDNVVVKKARATYHTADVGFDLIQNGDFKETSEELVPNGDFTEEGSELVSNGSFDYNANVILNGDFSEIAPELIVDGDFGRTGPNIADESTIENAGGSIMTKLTTFTYNATSDGTGGSTVRPKLTFDDVVIGRSYILEIIPSNQSGTIDLKAYDGGGYYADSDLSGNFKQFFTCRGVNTFIAFDGTTPFNVDFTISLTEVCQGVSLQNNAGTTGWRLTDNRTLRMDSEAFVKNRNVGFIGNTLTAGKSYVLTLDIIDSNANMVVYVGGVSHPETLPTGTHYGYKYRFDSLGTGNILLYGGTGKIQEIDNVSVKEAAPNWVMGEGWSVVDDKAYIDGSQTATSTLRTYQGLSVQNKLVEISFEVSGYSAGFLNVTLEGTGQYDFSSINENGLYRTMATSTDALPKLKFDATSDFVGYIDKVSVREMPDWVDIDDALDFNNGEVTILGDVGNRRLRQSFILNQNQSYKLQYEVTSKVGSPNLTFYNGTAYVAVPMELGINTFYFKCLANPYFYFNNIATSGNNISLDNVSLKEVGDDWTLSDGWYVGDGAIICDGVSSNSNAALPSVLTNGKWHNVSLDVTLNSGQLQIFITGGVTYTVTTSGSYVFSALSDRPDQTFYLKSRNFDGSVTNISLVILDPKSYWNPFTPPWFLEYGAAYYNDSSIARLYQFVQLSPGKYELEFTIIDADPYADIWIGNNQGNTAYTFENNGYNPYYNGVNKIVIDVPSKQNSLAFYANVNGDAFRITDIKLVDLNDRVEAKKHLADWIHKTALNDLNL